MPIVKEDKKKKRRFHIKIEKTDSVVNFNEKGQQTIINCPKCGKEISVYYFTVIKKEDGTIIPTKCTNCGYYDDPE